MGLERGWQRLTQLRLTLGGQIGEKQIGPPVCVLFEGWDASGKGGAIKRLVAQMDPRHVRVVSSSRRRPTTRSATTSSGASGPCCRAGAGWPSSTAPGTGGCWSSGSRASPTASLAARLRRDQRLRAHASPTRG